VLPVRKASTAGKRLSELAAKATVLADDFSLRERGIRPDEMASGITAAPVCSLGSNTYGTGSLSPGLFLGVPLPLTKNW
jgi:hypothetical protein